MAALVYACYMSEGETTCDEREIGQTPYHNIVGSLVLFLETCHLLLNF